MRQVERVIAATAVDAGEQIAHSADTDQVVTGTEIGIELVVALNLQRVGTATEYDAVEGRNLQVVVVDVVLSADRPDIQVRRIDGLE